MSPALESALAKCDDIGVSLRLDGESVAIAGGSLPVGVRDTLKAHKPELVELLRTTGRPAPDPVLFVSARLEVEEYASAAVVGALWVYVGERPFYRLTPAVLCWLGAAIDKRVKGLTLADPDRVSVTHAMGPLCYYVHGHFRSDQIIRAMVAPKLPKAMPPPAFLDATPTNPIQKASAA